MDLITVGITCFNAEDTIERAVRSAQAQTWDNIEIVVADDASRDRSRAIVQQLASGDARIRVVHHETNSGVASARNTILKHATGTFIAFFDDDDVSVPQRLERQHRRITTYEQATGITLAACYTATRLAFPDGHTAYSPALGMDRTPAPSGQDVARLILIGRPADAARGLAPTSSLMARRTTFDAVDGFDAALRRHEDTDFNLRLALRGGHFPGIAEPLVTQTVTPTAEKSAAVEREIALAFIEKHRDVLASWNWYAFSRQWCEMKFAWFEGGWARALPHAARMFLTAPVKTARKVAWALPNRRHYRRYQYSTHSKA